MASFWCTISWYVKRNSLRRKRNCFAKGRFFKNLLNVANNTSDNIVTWNCYRIWWTKDKVSSFCYLDNKWLLNETQSQKSNKVPTKCNIIVSKYSSWDLGDYSRNERKGGKHYLTWRDSKEGPCQRFHDPQEKGFSQQDHYKSGYCSDSWPRSQTHFEESPCCHFQCDQWSAKLWLARRSNFRYLEEFFRRGGSIQKLYM